MKEKQQRPYSDWVYGFGIISSLIIAVIMMAFPVIASIVFGVWPNIPAIIPALISCVAWLAPFWISQTLGFMQSMGPGALYSCFVTGNTTNLKLPAIMATQSICDVEPCSEQAQCVAVLAAGGSAICVMLMMVIGVCFSRVIQPLIESPVLAPAFNYAVSALFGAVVATNVNTLERVGFWVTPFLVSLFFCYCTGLANSWYMLIAILASVIVGRIYYNVTEKKKKQEEQEV